MQSHDPEVYPWAPALPTGGKQQPLFHVVDLEDGTLEPRDSLAELAVRCGQRGALEQVAFHAASGRARSQFLKVLVQADSAGQPCAAVILQHYKLRGIPTGIYRACDFGGERTVIAPQQLRRTVAAQAANFLLARGALLVHLSILEADWNAAVMSGDPKDWTGSRFPYAVQHRTLFRTLELKATYDATLAQFGHTTRRNFRHQARKFAADFAVAFEVEPKVSETEFLAFDRCSSYPNAEGVALWRYRVGRHFPNSFFAALRAGDGSLISVLGGRRQDATLDVDWQMNRADLKGYSPATAMRAHLIQDELKRGTRWIRFEGGTTHSMAHGFLKETICDLVFTRSLVPRRLVNGTLPRILPDDSLLGRVLKSDDLRWSG